MASNILWLKGLPEDQVQEFKRIFDLERNSKVWTQLSKIIDSKIASLEASERNIDIYDNPNWSFMQAHNNGARQTLYMIKHLLK